MGTNSKGITEYQKDGKTLYKVNTTFRTLDNQPYKKGKQGFKSKREALQWKTLTEIEIKSKTLFELNSKKTFINVLIDQYISDKSLKAKPTSIQHEKTYLVKMFSVFGNKRVSDIAVRDIQDYYNAILQNYTNTNTINQLISYTMNFVNWLELNEYITRTIHNKFQLILVKKEHKQGQSDFFEVDEIKKLLDTFDMNDYASKRYKLFFTILFYSGMRKSECRALQYTDIDYVNNTIKVNKQYVRQANSKGKTKLTVVNYTKTNVDKVVTVPSWLIEMILEARQIDQARGKSDDNIFIYRIDLNDTTIKRVFDSACEAAGLPHKKIHSTRHTYTAMILDKGVDLKFAQSQLGHTNATTTKNIYDHITEQRKAAASDIIESLASII